MRNQVSLRRQSQSLCPTCPSSCEEKRAGMRINLQWSLGIVLQDGSQYCGQGGGILFRKLEYIPLDVECDYIRSIIIIRR